jgi:hypothetical protein
MSIEHYGYVSRKRLWRRRDSAALHIPLFTDARFRSRIIKFAAKLP